MDLDRGDANGDWDDEDEDGGYYSLKVQTTVTVTRTGEPDDFVDEFDGEIVYHAGGSNETAAGRFRAYVVRLDDASEAGEPSHDVFDAHSDGLLHYYEDLFDPKTDDYKQAVQRRFEVFGGDMLILDLIEVLPDHRGRGLGLAVASRLVDLLGSGCQIAACKPFPLQFNPEFGGDPEFQAKMRLEGFEKLRENAFRKIRGYWSKLGFKRVGRSDTYCLSLHLRRPKLEKLCDVRLTRDTFSNRKGRPPASRLSSGRGPAAGQGHGGASTWSTGGTWIA